MGSLFGGYLTRGNEVYLVDVNAARVEAIEREGVWIHEQDGTEGQYRPHAVTDAAGLPEMDLVIVFVKAMHTESALSANRALIGPGTYLMTLQNGAGHEARLLRYADRDHVIIGTTLHNGSLLENGHVNHGGGGQTTIGLLGGASERIAHIAKALSACALSCSTSDQVRRQIWSKLFLNTAASSLTAILQVPLGFILEDAHARGMMRRLAQEAVAVANAESSRGSRRCWPTPGAGIRRSMRMSGPARGRRWIRSAGRWWRRRRRRGSRCRATRWWCL